MTAAPYPHLFSPFMLGNLTLPNRTVMAPMSTNLASLAGAVTPQQIAFYKARAEGGTGMIIVEFCCVQASTGRSEHRQLTLEDEAHLPGHQDLVKTIISAGSIACLQLQHGGQGAKRELVKDGVPVVPSEVRSRRNPEQITARALTHDEIEELIECFGRTAELGVKAGYQAFELHGAHGYLLTSFISPFTNHRTDAWGGDEERRLEFPRRVIQRVKQAIGDRPLIYRLSADEFTPKGLGVDDMARIAPKLAAAGADALHVSLGLGWTSFDKVIDPMSSPEGWRLPYARRIRETAGVPVIAVGQIRLPATAERAVREGDADLIAFGRTLLADPEWANKAQRGEAETIRPCTSCNYCVTMSSGEHGVIGCAENPRTGRELESLPDAGARRGERAVVVGAGPGGMAAALMLDQAGFRTELVEARNELGGGLIASAAPPHKDKLTWYLDYLQHRLEKSHVAVRLDARATTESLTRDPAAIVVLAHGATPIHMDDVAGIDGANVIDAYELLMGDTGKLPEPGATVLVYGGGETGCEAAEWLSERGYPVLLVSRSPAAQLARSAEPVYRGVLIQRLKANTGVRLLDKTHLTAIAPDGRVTLQTADGELTEQVARVVIAQGRRPDTTLQTQLQQAGVSCVAIGDARQGGRIGDAVHHAYAAVTALGTTGTLAQEQLAC